MHTCEPSMSQAEAEDCEFPTSLGCVDHEFPTSLGYMDHELATSLGYIIETLLQLMGKMETNTKPEQMNPRTVYNLSVNISPPKAASTALRTEAKADLVEGVCNNLWVQTHKHEHTY